MIIYAKRLDSFEPLLVVSAEGGRRYVLKGEGDLFEQFWRRQR